MNDTIDQMQSLTTKAYNLGLEYAPKLALAIITLIVGLWLIGAVTRLFESSMKKSKVDATLVPFLTNLSSWILKLLLFISVASMLGIATTSFIAVLGAAGLAVGLALQGSLSNFAGGVLVMTFKPYKIGDLIESQGHLGVVKAVQIFNTIVISPQNKQIIIPNGIASNGSIINYTAEGQLRVDLVVGIAYNEDIGTAKSVIMDVLQRHEKVLSDPAPFVGVIELADSSVNLAVRPFCKVDDYWDVFFDINEQMKVALDNNNITIPFPQRDVHLSKV
ncbi:MAG: small conductance mechanosensitive channel [Gammaproteobacteria bacterium]|jgi:small conductance mechanosensitive channel